MHHTSYFRIQLIAYLTSIKTEFNLFNERGFFLQFQNQAQSKRLYRRMRPDPSAGDSFSRINAGGFRF